MKKTLLFCGLLICGFAQYSDAQDQPEFIETIELKRTTKTLEFKDILTGIYAQQIVNTQQYDSDEDFKPYTKTVFYDAIAEEKQLVLMHPAIVYKNSAGEIRYFVLLEKIPFGYSGYPEACRACSAKADFLIFKKQANGSFYLINYTLNATDLPGGAGRLKLDLQQIRKNMQHMGQQLTGSYFIGHYSGAGGEAGSMWHNLFLPEQGKIQVVDIGVAGRDTGSYYADRPNESSKTTSSLKVINNDSQYFPIEITYKTYSGTSKKPTFTKSSFTWDTKKNAYIEKEMNHTK